MMYLNLSINNNNKKQAFTLLEMSVVLVIIGLLVGAISITSGFLNSSKLNDMMTESKYFINAFDQFSQLTSSNHSVPGDFSAASGVWPGAVNGDGNGVIRAGATANNSELFGAFQHLALSGLLRGSYTGVSAGGAGTAVATIGGNIPASVIENVGYVFDHPNALDGNVTGDPLYFDGKYGHVLRVAAATPGGLPSTGFLTPMEALKLDDKYDDGAPGKGWITVPNTTASTCATSSTVYNTASTATLCYLIYNLSQ